MSDNSRSVGQRRRERREQQRTCVHFNGIQNEQCKAGMKYDDIPRTDAQGGKCQLPCLFLNPDLPQASCAKFLARTPEELDAEEREIDAMIEKHRIVGPAVAAWRKKPPRGKQEVIECPACHGRLHLSQSAYNGHVWGKCETAGCVSWME